MTYSLCYPTLLRINVTELRIFLLRHHRLPSWIVDVKLAAVKASSTGQPQLFTEEDSRGSFVMSAPCLGYTHLLDGHKVNTQKFKEDSENINVRILLTSVKIQYKIIY